MKIRAKHYETGQIREFSEQVWKLIPPISPMGGGAIPHGGWVEIPAEQKDPEAAVNAQKAADDIAAKNAAKQEELKAAANADLIASVEAKLKRDDTEFNYKTELQPYLDAKGWSKDFVGKSTTETVKELKKKLTV